MTSVKKSSNARLVVTRSCTNGTWRSSSTLCKFTVYKSGKVKVRTKGYRNVRVTISIVAVPRASAGPVYGPSPTWTRILARVAPRADAGARATGTGTLALWDNGGLSANPWTRHPRPIGLTRARRTSLHLRLLRRAPAGCGRRGRARPQQTWRPAPRWAARPPRPSTPVAALRPARTHDSGARRPDSPRARGSGPDGRPPGPAARTARPQPERPGQGPACPAVQRLDLREGLGGRRDAPATGRPRCAANTELVERLRTRVRARGHRRPGPRACHAR